MARSKAKVCRTCKEAEWAALRAFVERLWADGKSYREIRELAGIPSFTAGQYRKHGWVLPKRQRVGWGAWR